MSYQPIRVVPKGDPKQPRSGVMAQISFARIERLLRAEGAIRDDEKITDMVVDYEGGVIQYFVETRKP